MPTLQTNPRTARRRPFSKGATFQSFVAAQAVLKHLRQHLGFQLWMVTRTEGQDWTVLQAEDHGYGVTEGQVFKWEDTFCSRMVRNQGPRIVPNVADVPAYAAAPLAAQVPIGAYVGIPLVREDGSLFGTLCGIHPSRQPQTVEAELPLVELFGRLLSTILDRDLKAAEQARLTERVQAEAMKDPLTGVFNRRGWESLASAEELRCNRYGHPACVVSVDLDELKLVNDTRGHARGDELLRRAAEAIRSAARGADVVARVGGDEFLVLLVESDCGAAASFLHRLRSALAALGVEASVGFSPYTPSRRLAGTIDEADRLMYTDKGQRRSAARTARRT